MVLNARVIRDAMVIRIRCVSAMAIFARTLVAASMQPVEFIRISRSVIVHRIIHQAIQCMHVRIIFLMLLNLIYINKRNNNTSCL